MNAQFIPISLVLLSALYAGVGLLIWGRRPGLAITPFAWMMFSFAVWSLGYGLELLAPSLSGKLFWAKVEMFGIASVSVFLFSFSAAYTGRNNLLTKRNQALIRIIPTITVLLAWMPPYRSLIWETTSIGSSGTLTFLATDFGNWFWLQTAYSYTLILLASAFLVLEVVRSPRPYNIQAGIILLGILFPWVGSFLYLSGAVLPGIDLSPFAFAPTVILLAWGILRYRLLGILPMAPSMILHELQDGVVVIDARKRILYLNNLAEQLLQTTAEDAIGQPLESVQAACLDTLQRLTEQKEPYVEQEFTLNGQKRFYDVRILQLSTEEWGTHDTNASHLIIFRDIHHRKQAELSLQRREAIMGALNQASQQFLRAAAWETNIPVFLERIGRAADVGRAFVFQNYEEQDGQVFTSQCYEWAASGVELQIDNPSFRHIPIQDIGPASWHLDLGQEKLVTAQIWEFPETEQTAFIKRGVLSIVIVPIFVEQRWWGFFGLEDHAIERKWSQAELDALQAAAEIFSASEVRARNENTLRRRQRTLNLLHEIVVSALQTSDRRSMAQTIVNNLGNLINSDGCFLSLWDEAGEKFTPLAAYGPYSNVYLSLTAEPGEPTLTTSALAAGHTLIVDNITNTPFLSSRIAALLPFRSAMALPLIAGQKKLGAILLAYTDVHKFQLEEISIGEQAAGLIALTLEKFHAVEDASKRAEESEILRKAGAAVAATLHSEEAIDRILEQLYLVIPYDSASVQLLRENELEIVGGRGWDNPKEVLGLRFPVPGDNPNTVVLQTGKPYILGDAVKIHSSFKEDGPHKHIRSWLGVPMIVRGQITGLLAIDSTQLNCFTPNNVKIATTFADQVAIALENARLFEEVQNLALTDALTGLYNRRGLFEIGHIEFSRSLRLKRSFSVIMLDIDHFKDVNDRYGHPVGDQVLQFMASELRSAVRDADIVGRYGGEEFAIFLPGSDGKGAMELAQRLRGTIEKTLFYVEENEIGITISLGVAEYNENNPNLETLFARADQALYVAKHKGRNRVILGT
jgi:diguanylate cyclase (GGDEF)-like protein/PAS domain S-box-containing protein